MRGLAPKPGLAFFLAVACAFPGLAAVDLETWLETALPQHPSVREADVDLLYRLEREAQGWEWPDPEIRYTEEPREARGDQREIRLRLPLPEFDEERREQRREEGLRELAENGRASALVQGLAELRERYWEGTFLQSAARLRHEEADLFESILQRLEALNTSGWGEREEVVRFRVEYLEARADAINATRQLRRHLSEMAALAPGLPLFEEGLSTDRPEWWEKESPFPPLPELQRIALQHSPLIEEARLEQNLAAIEHQRSLWNLLPQPDYIQGSYVQTEGNDRDDWQISVNFILPVISTFRERSRAHLESARAEELARLQRDLIVRTLRQAHDQWEHSRSRRVELEELTGDFLSRWDSGNLAGSRLPPATRSRLIRTFFRLHRQLLEARRDEIRDHLDLDTLLNLHQPEPALRRLLQP